MSLKREDLWEYISYLPIEARRQIYQSKDTPYTGAEVALLAQVTLETIKTPQPATRQASGEYDSPKIVFDTTHFWVNPGPARLYQNMLWMYGPEHCQDPSIQVNPFWRLFGLAELNDGRVMRETLFCFGDNQTWFGDSEQLPSWQELQISAGLINYLREIGDPNNMLRVYNPLNPYNYYGRYREHFLEEERKARYMIMRRKYLAEHKFDK